MGLLDAFRGRRRQAVARHEADDATTASLQRWLAAHHGVEAWVEEPAGLNQASLLLVAHDGEWLRRTVTSTDWARRFCDRAGIPAYQAGVVGYPQRMRDHDARVRIERRRRQTGR